MTNLSAPRFEPTDYVVYPTGYDQSPYSDTYTAFTIKVRRFSDTGKRYVDGSIWHLSHTGRWIDQYRDRLNTKKHCRFDTAEEALELAMKHVDDRPGARNLPKIIAGAKGLDAFNPEPA
jgi:hypothetical protein